MKRLNPFILMFSLLSISFTANGKSDFSYLTLQGINTVAVQIKNFDNDLRSYGFKQNELQTLLEKKLAQAGFKIIPEQDLYHDDTASLIRLSFSDIKTGYGFYHYGVNLIVKEKIPLPRRENAFISATIWESNVNGAMQHHEIHKLQTAVDQLVERLIDEHKQQN